MNRCKHYLLCALAGALLLLPITSQYALDINWWKEKMSQYQETLQKTMPGALVALGVAGAMYYWWTRKKGGDDSGKGGENLIPKDLLKTPTLKQYQVYSQFNRDGGGAASCGYQTLLRGMQIVRAKNGNENDVDLEKTLMDSSTIAVYFGPGGEWREDIIAWRKNQELRKALHEKFLSVLAKNCDAIVQARYGSQVYEPIIAALKSKKLTSDKARDLYASALGSLENIVMVIAKNPVELSNQYEFTDEAICDYLAKSLELFKNETNEGLIKILQQPEMISECFNLERMRKEFLSESFLFDLPQFIQIIYSNPDLSEDFAGDWLSDGELEYLWQEHRVDIVPLQVNCGFKAIGNFELVDNPQYPKEFDEVAVYVDEAIKPLLNKKRQMFQIFALGTMRQTGSSTGTRGHWYPLVMYQNQNGERSYYITDSLRNTDRTRDINAWKIINLIEKAAK